MAGRRRWEGAAALALAASLAGCGGGAQPVGGLSADEAAQLNNAAEMLDTGEDDAVPANRQGEAARS